MEDEEGAAKDEKKEIREYLRFYNFAVKIACLFNILLLLLSSPENGWHASWDGTGLN